METEFFFLDTEVICKQGKFATTIYRKPMFSDVFSNIKSF